MRTEGRRQHRRGPGGRALPAAAALVALCLFAFLVANRPMPAGDPAMAAALDRVLLFDGLLPRGATALLAGAMLGLSGFLFQAGLRNPIADASTLGVASGAQLALTLCAGAAPFLGGLAAETTAFAGGCATLGIVVALCWRGGLDPVSVALSGMIVSLVAAAASVTVILARGEYALSLSIWGAGTLAASDWPGVLSLTVRLAAGLAGALLLGRPLSLLALGDRGARSLGVSTAWVRVLTLALAVWLAAGVTARYGVIGFLGLAAAAWARSRGTGTHAGKMLAACAAGALVLLIADTASQILGPGFADLVPVGAATALFGGPLLLFVIRGVKPSRPPQSEPAGGSARRVRSLGWLALAGLALLAAALLIGPDAHGIAIASPATLPELLPFRLPRLIAAMGGGALLGAAGVVMQRLTGNPIAGPEILGVAGGGGAGLALGLILFGFLSPAQSLAATGLGSAAATALVLAIAGRAGFSPERLLLCGVAIGAFSMAVVSLVLVQGDIRSFALLSWMSGATNRVGPFETTLVVAALLLLTPPLFAMGRWLAILPLGEGIAAGLGVPLNRVRIGLAGIAAAMTAIASFLVGPLTLIGLVAPHLARLLGFTAPGRQLAAAMLIGASTLGLADWLSRIVIFPYQTPVGLFAALLGGTYLLGLLARKAN